MQNDRLQHHGVKGMKWGVRRDRNQLGRPLSVKKKPSMLLSMINSAKERHAAGKAARTASENARPSPKTMSIDDLQNAVRRMQLEKQYNQMMREMNPPKFAKIRSFVGSMLADSAKQAGTAWLTKEMKKALKLEAKPKKYRKS